MDRSEVS